MTLRAAARSPKQYNCTIIFHVQDDITYVTTISCLLAISSKSLLSPFMGNEQIHRFWELFVESWSASCLGEQHPLHINYHPCHVPENSFCSSFCLWPFLWMWNNLGVLTGWVSYILQRLQILQDHRPHLCRDIVSWLHQLLLRENTDSVHFSCIYCSLLIGSK